MTPEPSQWSRFLEWLRARWLAISAAIFGVLALIYGRRTVSVLTAKVKANDAAGRVVAKKLEQAERKVGEAQTGYERSLHDARAQELQHARERLEDERNALIDESGDLPVMTDAQLADLYNRRGDR